MGGYPDAGLLIDAIVALVALEAIGLVAARRLFGRGPSSASSIANCAAGAALLMALRAAIGDAPFAVVALWLLAALLANVVDVALRWRGPDSCAAARPLSSSSALSPERSRV
ncbi:hypothetical protein DFR50_11618 [Roseiarcus fermentans]|uniref:Uncharacterized protein n=1 Tax=Roseiarcus fermentans TaxID=1473586 RepID=A0A366F9I5_9HYPH|nr:hypothetical protein [Roseiarcus fermentans]RBP11324.1 hypothetical protein DFR50_11618 [Roseiarcus fermentans]